MKHPEPAKPPNWRGLAYALGVAILLIVGKLVALHLISTVTGLILLGSAIQVAKQHRALATVGRLVLSIAAILFGIFPLLELGLSSQLLSISSG